MRNWQRFWVVKLLLSSQSTLGFLYVKENHARRVGILLLIKGKEDYLLGRGSICPRVILIKEVLSSLPVYCLSVFKCPVAVVEKLERIQSKFLWNDDIEKRKFHLVNWSQVCKPTEEGGLGV